MSYPLANLSYGLRCRFREFSTPCEAFNFGVVAPTFLGEKYVQKAVTCDKLTRCHFIGEFMERCWRNPNKLCIENCTFSEDFHVGHLCAVLRPHELVLKDNQLNGNWVDKFLMADTGCTRHLCIETNSVDVLNVNESTLWELFMVQGHNDFYVEIGIDADESLIAETLSRQFQSNFYPVDMNGYVKNTHIVLRVACKISLKNWFYEIREEESEY